MGRRNHNRPALPGLVPRRGRAGLFLAWAVIVLVVSVGCARPDSLEGTELSAAAAPLFELTDQFGNDASLADHMADVTVLTFLYTYCPDICPVVSSHLRDAHTLLGDDAGRTNFVAVSVDPARDTVERVYEYSEQWGMLHNWAFLVGEEDELAEVWKAYYLDPSIPGTTHVEPTDASEPHSSSGAIDTLRSGVSARYEVAHSSPVYLIDRDGLLRVVFTLPFDPSSLVHDVRLLLD